MTKLLLESPPVSRDLFRNVGRKHPCPLALRVAASKDLLQYQVPKSSRAHRVPF
jgi:hypothetical protein